MSTLPGKKINSMPRIEQNTFYQDIKTLWPPYIYYAETSVHMHKEILAVFVILKENKQKQWTPECPIANG